MIYLIFIIFGLAPSIIWLLFYLRKDVHPESKLMVLKIFFWGMGAGVLAFIIEIFLSWLAVFALNGYIDSAPIALFLLKIFIFVALVEEWSKFIIVRIKVIKNKEFDEPVDAMIYMIIAALGFAALENVLILFTIKTPSLIRDAALVSSFRFLGATFLHALASAVIGYFLALSICQPDKKTGFIIKGFFISSILHGLFNMLIIIIEDSLITEEIGVFAVCFVFLIIVMTSVAIFVSNRFKNLKHLQSVCAIKSNEAEVDNLINNKI